MTESASTFIRYLTDLKNRDRGAFAHLRRSLGFEPGAYPPSYPYVERFVGTDKRADDPWRKALYLTAGLFAYHSMNSDSTSLAAALGKVGRARGSASVELRFIALLGCEPENLRQLLRQAVSLLAADGVSCDYTGLLNDLAPWFKPWNFEGRDRLRQRWARDFYRNYDTHARAADELSTLADATDSTT